MNSNENPRVPATTLSLVEPDLYTDLLTILLIKNSVNPAEFTSGCEANDFPGVNHCNTPMPIRHLPSLKLRVIRNSSSRVARWSFMTGSPGSKPKFKLKLSTPLQNKVVPSDSTTWTALHRYPGDRAHRGAPIFDRLLRKDSHELEYAQ